MASRNVFYGDNSASPDTAFQFGPYTVTGTGKLVAVMCTLGISADGEAIAPTATIADPVSWGVQRGVSGYTPVVTPGQASSADWFWTELVSKSSFHNAAWTPDTDPAAYLVTGGTYQEWRGQEYRGSDTDYYVTGSLDVSGGPNFYAYHMLTVVYA